MKKVILIFSFLSLAYIIGQSIIAQDWATEWANASPSQTDSPTNNQAASTTNNQADSPTNNQADSTTNNQADSPTNNQADSPTNNQAARLRQNANPQDWTSDWGSPIDTQAASPSPSRSAPDGTRVGEYRDDDGDDDEDSSYDDDDQKPRKMKKKSKNSDKDRKKSNR